MANTDFEQKYNDCVDKLIEARNDESNLQKKIKQMQETLKSGGNCDGLCGMCLLWYDGEGCLIWHTLKGFKKKSDLSR